MEFVRGIVGCMFVNNTLLTSRQTAVRATQVDVAFRDRCHAKLVVGSSEEGSKSAGKHHIPLPGCAACGNAHLRVEKRSQIYNCKLSCFKNPLNHIKIQRSMYLQHKPSVRRCL